MSEYILAYDLGTSGCKATIYDTEGICIKKYFESYETIYPLSKYHEQKPLDWWDAFIKSTKGILEGRADLKKGITAIAISGHSLGAVPISKKGELLLEITPIWSDTRADIQAGRFFKTISEDEWYQTTGNGFARECYPVFKILWYKDNYPEVFDKIDKIIGTKDFINFKLTGEIFTDYSYASGYGVYDLLNWKYSEKFIEASGLNSKIFPSILPSTGLVGTLNDSAATVLGLNKAVKVYCGGVDNSCMALGARNIAEGRLYTNIGSSGWIAVSSGKPIIDLATRPFVFTHVMPAMYTSSFGIFSAGNSLKWVKENICTGISGNSNAEKTDLFKLMDDFAEKSPVGSKNLIFNPSLGGGSKAHPSPNIRGAYIGLDLSHDVNDLIRSSMEGIALDLKIMLEKLEGLCALNDEVLVVGGGSKSRLWRQIFSDVYDKKIIKTDVGQEAAALGAAAVAAVGMGAWTDFSKIDEIHKVESICEPVKENVKEYHRLLKVFKAARDYISIIGDRIVKET
jgi:xylulokinase